MKKKKIFLALAFCLFMGSVSAQTMKDIFPDEKLAQCVLEEYNKVNVENTISDSDEVTEENLKEITILECGIAGVKDTKGIEKLEGLTKLSLYNNQLTSIDLSHNTALESLYLENNQLTSIDLSHNTALGLLALYNNQLTGIDLSKNTALKTLYLEDNQLTSIDLSHNTALVSLSLSNNKLTSIDLSKNTELKWLILYNNQLTSIDLSHNTALTKLYLYSNQLTSIDLGKNTKLDVLWLHDNKLTSIDLSKNTELTDLSLSNNQLTSIDLSKNIELEELYLYNNSFLKEVKINDVGNYVSLSDYVNLIDKYGVEYKIDDESIAKYDANTGKIIGLKEGTTSAKLTINGTIRCDENHSDCKSSPVEFESTITVINNTSDNSGSSIIDDGNTTSGTTTNPGTGVKVFAFVDCLVIIGAISCYVVVRRKNKYKKI